MLGSQAGCPILVLALVFTNPLRLRQLDWASLAVPAPQMALWHWLCARGDPVAAGSISDLCVTVAGGEGREESSPREGGLCFIYIFIFIIIILNS